MLSLLWMLSCGGGEVPSAIPPDQPAPKEAVGIAAQAGEQHPPLPANNPSWVNVSPNFKPTPMVYGEERWDDVSMRVIGHMAQAVRDLARLDWQEGQKEEAIGRYRKLATFLMGLNLNENGPSRALRNLHAQAANHHAAVLSRKVGRPVPEPAHLGPNSTLRWARTLSDSVEASTERPWQDLKIDAFVDFRDRHALRLRMNEYWLDSVDPIAFSDPWGYWRPQVADATADALSDTAPFSLSSTYPSVLSAEDLGRLPTGDSYLDSAGGAGPMSIGTLAVLGLNDPAHRKRLEGWAEELNTLLREDTQAFVERIQAYHEVLDAYDHGSRFYNIKQLLNAGTRHLARAGHYKEALLVFQMHRPLHAQDWFCPNRLGIQLGIEGRLLALSGQPSAARETLNKAVGQAEIWFQQIDEAKKAPQHGPKGPPTP